MRNLKFSTIALAFGLAIWAPVFLGCGASQRTDTLKATYVAVNAANSAFNAWDLAHQREIKVKAKASGKTRDQVLADLALYYDQREPVRDGFIAVYSLIAAGLTINDQPTVEAVLKAASDLQVAITNLKKASEL